jgi:hypothetical protein
VGTGSLELTVVDAGVKLIRHRDEALGADVLALERR